MKRDLNSSFYNLVSNRIKKLKSNKVKINNGFGWENVSKAGFIVQRSQSPKTITSLFEFTQL